jgi:hypothetical protein
MPDNLPTLPSQHSPTGDAPLPQWAVRLALALVTTAGVVQAFFPTGGYVDMACKVVLALGTAFGIASQGVRR